MLDIAEDDDHFGSELRLDRLDELFTDLVDVEFIEDVSIDEVDPNERVILADTDVRGRGHQKLQRRGLGRSHHSRAHENRASAE